MLPVDSPENILMMNIGSGLVLLSGFVAQKVFSTMEFGSSLTSPSTLSSSKTVFWIQMILVGLADFVVTDQGFKKLNKEGLGLFNQGLSWFILGTSTLVASGLSIMI